MIRRDAVLLVERGRGPFRGLWSFPGGRAEPGEDAEGTARRELFEETGLDVGQLVELGVFEPTPSMSLTVFAARAGAGKSQAGDDALHAEFVPLSQVLARPLTAGAPGWIARALLALANPPLL